jgi:hypothetical protein
MTMHLLPIYFTNTNKSNKRKKTKNKRVLAANSAHKAWIQEITDNKKCDKKLVNKYWLRDYNDSIKVYRPNYVSSGLSGSSDSCVDRSIMTRLHKESKATREEILRKASRCMPLFNKGGLQYATDGEDLTQVGSKSRRG